MFKRNLNRGFTLIELLVVIAIIGILAATVLASLGTARQSGSNASAIGSLSSMRAQAEIYYNTSSTGYTGVCASMSALTTATRLNGAGGSGAAAWSNTLATPSLWSTTAIQNQGVCHESATQWAASVPLNGTAANYACVDSTGASKTSATALLANGALFCP